MEKERQDKQAQDFATWLFKEKYKYNATSNYWWHEDKQDEQSRYLQFTMDQIYSLFEEGQFQEWAKQNKWEQRGRDNFGWIQFNDIGGSTRFLHDEDLRDLYVQSRCVAYLHVRHYLEESRKHHETKMHSNAKSWDFIYAAHHKARRDGYIGDLCQLDADFNFVKI